MKIYTEGSGPAVIILTPENYGDQLILDTLKNTAEAQGMIAMRGITKMAKA